VNLNFKFCNIRAYLSLNPKRREREREETISQKYRMTDSLAELKKNFFLAKMLEQQFMD